MRHIHINDKTINLNGGGTVKSFQQSDPSAKAVTSQPSSVNKSSSMVATIPHLPLSKYADQDLVCLPALLIVIIAIEFWIMIKDK